MPGHPNPITRFWVLLLTILMPHLANQMTGNLSLRYLVSRKLKVTMEGPILLQLFLMLLINMDCGARYVLFVLIEH